MSSFSDPEALLSASIAQLAKKEPKLKATSIRGLIHRGRGGNHGDFSSPAAMALASANPGLKAGEIAEALAAEIRAANPDWLERVEVAGPGFINFFLHERAAADSLLQVLEQGDNYGRTAPTGQRLLLEFVSSNPTGPLHTGHGRGAATGLAVANLARAAGWQVDCEYYVNDRGRQSQVLAVSAWLRALDLKMPAGTYRGNYLAELAEPERALLTAAPGWDADRVRALIEAHPGDEREPTEKRLDALIGALDEALGAQGVQQLCDRLQQRVLKGIRTELDALGVRFDSWFSESSLYRPGPDGSSEIDRMLERMLASGSAHKRDDGALWFAASQFGDDKDRVLVRANGEPTYFASDVAYHLGKFRRGYDKLINVWGADHHGYEQRLRGALRALGEDDGRLQVLYVQFVSLIRGGERVGMSTRAGSFVPLAELLSRVPADAVKLTYLSCAAGQHLDFDLDAAIQRSKDNPVFYIQYAHARICSMERKFGASKWSDTTELPADEAALALLDRDSEVRLRREIDRFASLVRTAAERQEPHRVTTYLRDLAGLFHSWYNAERVLVEDPTLRAARLTLSRALRQVFANGLNLLGVEAPERM